MFRYPFLIFFFVSFSQISLEASSNLIEEQREGNKTNNILTDKILIPEVSVTEEEKRKNNPQTINNDLENKPAQSLKKDSNVKNLGVTTSKAFDRVQSYTNITSALLKLCHCDAAAEKIGTFSTITKACSGIVRIGYSAINLYHTQDLSDLGEAIRGSSDLISIFLDGQAGNSYSIMQHLKKEKENIEVEVKITKRNNLFKIQNLQRNIEKSEQDIERSSRFKELTKEPEVLALAQRMLEDALRFKMAYETEIELIKKSSEEEDEKIQSIERQISLKEQEFKNNDKGAFFVRAAAVFSQELGEQEYDCESIARATKNTMIVMTKSDPNKVLMYGQEIVNLLTGFYKSYQSPQ